MNILQICESGRFSRKCIICMFLIISKQFIRPVAFINAWYFVVVHQRIEEKISAKAHIVPSSLTLLSIYFQKWCFVANKLEKFTKWFVRHSKYTLSARSQLKSRITHHLAPLAHRFPSSAPLLDLATHREGGPAQYVCCGMLALCII